MGLEGMVSRKKNYRTTVGHRAEEIFLRLLSQNGFRVVAATANEDHHSKIDFWLWDQESSSWLPVQMTTSFSVIATEKKKHTMDLGVIFVQIQMGDLIRWKKKRWENQEKRDLTKVILDSFWNQVRNQLKIIANYLQEPSFNPARFGT